MEQRDTSQLTPRKHEISEETLNKILAYLQRQPWVEVNDIMYALFSEMDGGGANEKK